MITESQPTTIVTDGRPIASLSCNRRVFIIDKFQVTDIKPYKEADNSVWFEIWKGKFLWTRINRDFVEQIRYKKPEVEDRYGGTST